MATQTQLPKAGWPLAFSAFLLWMVSGKDIQGPNFSVPPTLPANASKLWLVDGKVLDRSQSYNNH